MYLSHINQHIIIGTELIRRGHNVSIVLSESFPNKEAIPSEFRIMTYATRHEDFYSIPQEDSDEIMETAAKITPIQDTRWHAQSFESMCRNALEDEALYQHLLASKIDLAVVDGFCYTRCMYILMHNLNIPYISTTTIFEPWLLRNPALPSFVPFQLATGPYSTSMTLIEKIHNFLTYLDFTAFPRITMMEDHFVQEYIRADKNNPPVTYSQLSANSLLWLIDADWAMDYPRPSMPNEINIGGLSTRPAKPLTGDIQKFVDGANSGLILVTFGSYDALSPNNFEKILEAFRQIKQHRILMRYARDLTVEVSKSLPKHLMIAKWVPQNDILGHPNTQLFITHGGANGQHEALYHAVPLITISQMADQPYNALRAEYFGCGLRLSILSLTTEALVNAVLEVMGNRSYADNMAWRSAAFRSARDTPKERAAWWIEYVMKNGAKHLRAHALDMPWYEYLMLDMLLVLVVLPVSFITFCLTTLLYCCLCRTRQNNKTFRQQTSAKTQQNSDKKQN